MKVITGQITYRRAVSKKLVFYDVLADTNNSPVDAAGLATGAWVEVLLKAGVFGSIQDVKDLRDKLKLGDRVAVHGVYDSQQTLQATKILVLEAWRTINGNVAFRPQPSPLHQSADTKSAAPQQPASVDQQGQDGSSQPQTVNVLLPAEAELTRLQEVESTRHKDLAATEPHTQLNGDGIKAGPSAKVTGCPTSGLQQPQQQLQKPQSAVCKFWINGGRCVKGSACPYAHLQASVLKPTKATWLRERHQRRQVLASQSGYCHNESEPAKGRRAQLFAAWLVDKYGKVLLNAGAGVVDIAGGAGWLAYELTVIHGVKCTLVDPRPLKLNKWQHKQLDQLQMTATVNMWAADDLQQQGQQPAGTQHTHTSGCNHQQAWMPGEIKQLHPLPGRQDDLHQASKTSQQQAQLVSQQDRLQVASAAASTHDIGRLQPLAEPNLFGQQGSTCRRVESAVCFNQVQGFFGPELWRSNGWQQVLGSCSLVIGLHPDQATEPMVDYAVESQKPFAVVPCCVFPRQFPHRQLVRDGQVGPVVTYAEFVEYLVAKACAKQEVLSFEGANTVVYRV